MTPFLKWAGGKRWLAKQIGGLLPPQFNRYIEPFLGSGAIFFELLPGSAILSDSNRELIETYRAVRDHPKEVYKGLRALHRIHGKKTYYSQRALTPTDKIERAVRFIYLNRTCWNGLYRVNKHNEFNVPVGTKTAVVFPWDDFEEVAAALSKAKISACDFELTIERACRGDFLYVDPPYTVKHNFNGFLKYNQTMFSWSDQIRLHDALVRARTRGCHIIMSNADHQSLHDLYSDFAVWTLPRSSVIAGYAMARGKTSELLAVHHG